MFGLSSPCNISEETKVKTHLAKLVFNFVSSLSKMQKNYTSDHYTWNCFTSFAYNYSQVITWRITERKLDNKVLQRYRIPMQYKGWFPYDRKRSQTIADDRGSQIVDRRRSQRDLFPYNRRRSQTIAAPTVAIHFVQRKCHMYSRVVLAGKS